MEKKICLHILHWATESQKYIILTLFYDQNYVNLSNLKFHPLCHTKSSFFWKSPINILDQYASCTYCLSTFINCVELFRVLFKKWNERIWISLSNHFKTLTWYLQNNVTYNKMSHLKLATDTKLQFVEYYPPIILINFIVQLAKRFDKKTEMWMLMITARRWTDSKWWQ